MTCTPSFPALNTNPLLSPFESFADVERVTAVRLADFVIVQLRCRPDNPETWEPRDAKIKAIRLTCKTSAFRSLEHRDEIVRHNN